MIRIFPSRLEGEPLEVHHTEQAMTLREWIEANAPDFDFSNESILTVYKNGAIDGIDCHFTPADVVEVYIEPQGAVAVVVAATIIGAVVTYAVMSLMSKDPANVPRGKQIGEATLGANKPRMGEPIPEIFGSPPKTYPDYLVPPRRYYQNKREQVLETLLCLGVGTFQKSLNNVYIGDTPLSSLEGTVEARFYEPGESVSGDSRADWWHTSEEVGGTSGSQGIKIYDVRKDGSSGGRKANYSLDVLQVNSNSIDMSVTTIKAGDKLDVKVFFNATDSGVRRYNGTNYDFFTLEDGAAPGWLVDNTDFYVDTGSGWVKTRAVKVFDGAEPQDGDIGTPSSLTGNRDFTEPFVTSSSVMSITKGNLSATVVVSGTFEDEQELRDYLSTRLPWWLEAVIISGSLTLRENSPYSGDEIRVSDPDDVMGSNPVSFIGEANKEPDAGYGKTILVNNNLDIEKGDPVALAPTNDGAEVTLVAGSNFGSGNRNVYFRYNGSILPDWGYTADFYIEVWGERGGSEWAGPFKANPANELCDAFEIDIYFPQGLAHIEKKSGSITGKSQHLDVRWRVGGGAWQDQRLNYTDSTNDAIGFTHRIELNRPTNNLEVSVRHTGSVSGGTRDMDEAEWLGLRARMVDSPKRYEGVTTLAVKIRSGTEISAQTDDRVWCKVTRELPFYNQQKSPTRDIMPTVKYILDECGYSDSFIDVVAFLDLHEKLSQRGDYFDASVADPETVKRLLRDILKAGFSEAVIDRGLLTVVRDEQQDHSNYIYGPHELIDHPTTTTEMVRPDDVDGVEVEYVDEFTGEKAVVEYLLPGDKGRRIEKIKARGVTNRTRAWRMAARRRRELAFRRTGFKATTELHALNSRYMSVDTIHEGLPEFGQSAFLSYVDGDYLGLSEAIEWNHGDNLLVAMRHKDGKVSSEAWVRKGRTPYEIESPFPLSDLVLPGTNNVDPTVFYFGNRKNIYQRVIVKKISPKSNGTVDIEAVNYDDRVYLEDNREPDDTVYHILKSDTYKEQVGATGEYANKALLGGHNTESAMVSTTYKEQVGATGEYGSTSAVSRVYETDTQTSLEYGATSRVSEYKALPMLSTKYKYEPSKSVVYKYIYATTHPYPVEQHVKMASDTVEPNRVWAYDPDLRLRHNPPDKISTAVTMPSASLTYVLDWRDIYAESDKIGVGVLSPAVRLAGGLGRIDYEDRETLSVASKVPSALMYTKDGADRPAWSDAEAVSVVSSKPSVELENLFYRIVYEVAPIHVVSVCGMAPSVNMGGPSGWEREAFTVESRVRGVDLLRVKWQNKAATEVLSADAMMPEVNMEKK